MTAATAPRQVGRPRFVRVRRVFAVLVTRRIREALAAVLAFGFGFGLGLTMLVLPDRHYTPTLEDAYAWGVTPSAWGLMLFLAGTSTLVAMPWYARGAPSIPLACLAVVLAVFGLALIGGLSQNGAPGAPWVYLTGSVMATLLSLSYAFEEMLAGGGDSTRGPGGRDA